MHYWLLKSEPGCYSIDDLANDQHKTTFWDGVRNYQARNMLRDQMKKNDLAFFYHSTCDEPGIVGIVTIIREGYPDFTAFDPENRHYDPRSQIEAPRWFMVDIKLKKKFKRLIRLAELRKNPQLKEMVLLRKGNRLSVLPVTAKEWQTVLAML